MSETIALPERELILPPGVKPPEVDPEFESAEQKAKSLPYPRGWRLLCALVDATEKYDSGLLKADNTKKAEELTSPVLFVVDMGPDCYQDKTRFPNGPWCQIGDFVIVRPNAGTRLKIQGREFRLINDDSVESVVQDPRGISRA